MAAKHFYEFGSFRLDPSERQLLCNSEPVALTPKCFDLLVILVEHSGHLLEKEELLQRIWPNQFVEESNLSFNISTLRKALAERSNGQRYIETVPKKGFRFVAGVTVRSVTERGLLVQDARQNGTRTEDDGSRGGSHQAEPSGVHFGLTRVALNSLRRRIIVGVITVGIVSLLVYGFSRKPNKPAAEPPRTIAVLPFKGLAAQSQNKALEVGLADSLITKLSKIKQLTVRPTSAVVEFAGVEQNAVTIGRTLKVDAVLESSFQQAGDRFKIYSRLVRVNDERTLWSFACEDQCVGVLTMQDSVSQSIARELNFNLSAEEQKLLTKRYTNNDEVYQLYLYGRAAWNRRTREGTEKAIDFFQQALERQPNYAPAYSGLADCYITLGSIIASSLPQGVMPKARYAAERALSIDDSLAEAHASLGFVLLWYEWDFAGAKREFERAIELDPKYATAHQWYAHYLTVIGHHEEAIREGRVACELDPTSPNKSSELGYLLYFARQYNRAIEQAEKAHELDPHMRPMYSSGAYIQLNQYAEAVEYHLQANAAAGAKPEKLDELRSAFQTGGIRAFWKKQIEQFMQAPRQEGEITRYLAILYALLGEKDKALAHLEKMYAERNGFLIYLKVSPAFDGLRSDPRFSRLLQRINLTQ